VSDSRPLRVAYDATSLLGRRTGIGHVTAAMLAKLQEDPTLDLEAFAVTWRGRKDLPTVVPTGVRASTHAFPARLARILWPAIGHPRAEYWTGEVDLVHATNYVAPPSKAPVLVTVHDLTFLRFPEMCTKDTLSYGRHLRRAIDAGAVIQSSSHYVVDEISAEFGLRPDQVAQIYCGLEPVLRGDAARGRARAGADRYLITLSTIEPRKNLPAMVRAFDAVAAEERDLHLVMVGPDGWGVEEFHAALAAAKHGDRVHRIGYVAKEERADLLAGATALAYPSIYEGFGLPPLEAMQSGVPVVASNAGPIPEVLGDAALLPDPHDDDSIADALRRIVSDSELRATLVERGTERVRRYTWDIAGPQFVELYHRVAAR
jgi:glycosyltransferase involved in cell wall biosynthesis